jgi:mycothiol synthase
MSAPRLPSPDLGLTWRAISLDDIDVWRRLTDAIEAHDEPNEAPPDRDDLIDELTSGSHQDPTRDSIIGIDADGTARAFGHLTALPGTTLRRAFLWGGVHPDWRGRGIGREVLRWQTERAHEAIAEQAVTDPTMVGTPWRIAAHCAEHLAGYTALYSSAGYTLVRWFYTMIRPLGADATPIPDVAAPAALRIAPWTEDRDEDVRLAHNEAFAEHWGSQPRDTESWKNWTIEHRTFRRDWSRVALDPSRPDALGQPSVAGYVISHANEHEWEALGYSEGHIALIGVRPAWRGRKLAPALLAEVMRLYAAAGIDTAGLDVDAGNATGALSLYEGMGFHVKETSVTWTIEGF